MIKSVCVASDEAIRRNKEHAASLGLPGLAVCAPISDPMAIVGGGDSAALLGDWPGHVLAINGAYNWLQDQGRVAEMVMCIDPQPLLAGLLQRPAEETTFYVASMCAPETFEALSGYDVQVFDSAQTEAEIGVGSVPGGTAAMTRAPILAFMLGYRSITLFGADCSYSGATHIYGGKPEDEHNPPVEVVKGGKTWKTNNGLIAQAEYLAELIPALAPHAEIRLAGDHMASAFLEAA